MPPRHIGPHYFFVNKVYFKVAAKVFDLCNLTICLLCQVIVRESEGIKRTSP